MTECVENHKQLLKPKITLKSFAEAQQTIMRDNLTNRGFLKNRHIIYVLFFGLILSFFSRWILIGMLFFLFFDFCVYVGRRIHILRVYQRGTPCLRTVADHRAVAEAYQTSHKSEPTMSDWERIAGFSKQPQWKIDLRYHEIIRMRGNKSDDILLDVGTGDGRLGWQYGIHKNARMFIGIDIELNLLKIFKKHISNSYALQCEGTQFPFKSETINFIVCTEVFEHLSEPNKAIREFNRVLTSGGGMIIQSPNATRIRNFNPFHILQCILGIWFPTILFPKVVHENTWFRAYTYHWDFTIQQIRNFCKPTGLKIKRIFATTYLFNPKGNFFHKLGYFLFRYVPIVNRLGWDLTVLLEKPK